MHVGALTLWLSLGGNRSLKEKRRILSSLKDRLRRQFNVAVAEVDEQDSLESAVLGIVAVSADKRHVNSQLSSVSDWVERTRLAELDDMQLELW